MSSKVVIHPLTELADWIDSQVIAEAILEELEEQGVSPTLENGQKVWLDFLETKLSEGLHSSVKAIC